MQTGIGEVAVPYSEIRAWVLVSGEELEAHEPEWLHKMSSAFAGEISRARDEDVPPPFEGSNL